MQIRLARQEDQKEILELLNGVFFGQQRSAGLRDEKYWNWKFLDNPFGPSLLTVAEDKGRIVGVDHLWKWEFLYHGSEIKAAQPCDTVVHADFRSQGIFKAMRTHGLDNARQQGVLVIFNFPNANSLPGNLSLGSYHLGKIPWQVKVLKPMDLIRSRFLTKKTGSISPGSRFQVNAGTLDELSKLHHPEDHRLRINRKSGFHTWRYLEHPSRYYGMVRCDKGSEVAVAIFTLNQKGSGREMVVVDLLGSRNLAKELFNNVLITGRELDVTFVALMNNPDFKTKQLWKATFIPRRLKNMTVLSLDWDQDQYFREFSGWSLVAGMHDSI